MKRKGVIYRRCPKCGEDKLVLGSTAQSGKKRYRCETGCRYQTTNPDAPYRGKGEPEKRLEFDQPLSDRVVVTWAQNATPIHKGFFRALQAYCAENRATLLVVPGRYKNPTSHWDASQRNAQWWAPELVPYLVNKRKKLNANLILLADINTQPTAVTPLSGFESITHAESGILAHPKLQMNVIPTPHKRMPKILTTTGAVTIENYTDTKAGKKGEFHHVLGAVIVELQGTTFHLRHINARRDGAFCDLDRAYYPDGSVRDAGPYEGIVFGDAHPRFADPLVVGATFELLVPRLNPKVLVFHDLLDCYAVNPHHQGNPFIALSKEQSGRSNIWNEVDETIEWVKAKTGERKAVIVPSNHDNMLARWMRNHDWRTDPENAEFYLETAHFMVKNTKHDSHGAVVPDPFQYWVRKAKLKNVRCLDNNESFTLAGIECGLHGHEGPNGSRGSRANLSKIGVKTIIGHSHTPGITQGCYQAGTMTHLNLEYTGPVGSWLNAHVSIDSMGKRHIHICIDGAFWK